VPYLPVPNVCPVIISTIFNPDGIAKYSTSFVALRVENNLFTIPLILTDIFAVLAFVEYTSEYEFTNKSCASVSIITDAPGLVLT
jgi:hypothetical protein